MTHKSFSQVVSNNNYTFNYTETSQKYNVDFHLHDNFEIYIPVSENIEYLIEGNIFYLKPWDIIITNKNELHKPIISSDIYKRYFFHLMDSFPFLDYCCTSSLKNCFLSRKPGIGNHIRLSNLEKESLIGIINSIEIIYDSNENNKEILIIGEIIKFLVHLNNWYEKYGLISSKNKLPELLVNILTYIENHLLEELSLEQLEKNFFVNKYYLSRLFKKHIGKGLSEYILYKKIAQAKTLFKKDLNLTEICELSGFNDYSGFYKMFKKIVGTSPSVYKKSII